MNVLLVGLKLKRTMRTSVFNSFSGMAQLILGMKWRFLAER
jgi:hypothetical protein